MSPVLTASSPVTAAVFDLLQDPALQAAIGGRLFDDIPEDTPRPCCLIEILNETDIRGFGTGGLPELDLRVHVFSDLGSLAEAYALNTQIVALLKDAAITIAGYQQCGTVVYHETVTLRSEDLGGIKVHEVVSIFTVWAEQTS